ncbi:hypothetical protein ACHAQH_005016 [Verticillium albo-atrum]
MKAGVIAVFVGVALAAPSPRDAMEMDSASSLDTAKRQAEDFRGTAPSWMMEADPVGMEICTEQVAKGTFHDVLECLNITNPGSRRRQITGSQEMLAKITQDCAQKTPGDQGAIYDCVLEAVGLTREDAMALLSGGMRH